MKLNRFVLNVCILLCVGLLSSCNQELDLDDETQLLLEKQETLKKLDALYDLAFEDPVKAENDFNLFVNNELITETMNLLINSEINNSYSFTKLAIQLNRDHQEIVKQYSTTSLFKAYKMMFETDLSVRTLLGSIPEQLKQGAKLEKFKAKIAEIKAFHQDKIDSFQNNTTIDESIINKTWNYMGTAYKNDFSIIHPITFNFLLKQDKSWDFESFFFMPAIPRTGALATPQDEQNFDKETLISPKTYYVYNNHIYFYFHIRNNYNYESQTGKPERHWCYEYKYEVKDGTLQLSEPRILYYMFPTIINAEFDTPIYKENYLDQYTGFENGYTLSVS